MRIAIDIMGGDNAPEAIIEGAMLSAKENPQDRYLLVGQEDTLNSIPDGLSNIVKITANSVMKMDESVESFLQKKDSSIWIATKLVKDKEADAVVSAGSTAAQMGAALLLIGRLRGITRPAIMGLVPTLEGHKVFLDMGANIDCTPEMLYQFALMGDVYARALLDIANPRIAILSNGSEEHKGNSLTLAASALLKQSKLNFIGNKEGRDIVSGGYDVMVTDGFSGNIALKTIEGISTVLFQEIKNEVSKNLSRKLGAALVMPGLTAIKKRFDYKEYGGAPLAGIKGLSIICHGSSNAVTIRNAVQVARDCIDRDFIGKISSAFAKED